MRDRVYQNLVSIPIRDLMNLEQSTRKRCRRYCPVSIPIRDLMNLEPANLIHVPFLVDSFNPY